MHKKADIISSKLDKIIYKYYTVMQGIFDTMKQSNNFDITEDLFEVCPGSVFKYYNYSDGVISMANIPDNPINTATKINYMSILAKGVEMYILNNFIGFK